MISRSRASYLAHVEHIAAAQGAGAATARTVKRADLADRMAHPAIRADGWAPAYGMALAILRGSAEHAAGDGHFMRSV